jgi:hypothetical protein
VVEVVKFEFVLLYKVLELVVPVLPGKLLEVFEVEGEQTVVEV